VATFPATFPVFALDRLWVHPRGALRSLVAHRTGAARLASDHLPVVADIEVASP
jgi:endonuclease/exonuclease/phosphatase family metal-dependent hydrolase